MTCTFFGHRITKSEIEPELRSTLIDLIEKNEVNLFYVGNQGGFDLMVSRVLEELSKDYDIQYYTVSAYISAKQDILSKSNDVHTLLPDGIETVPKRFAINYRNKWMIEHSDYVVTYVSNRIGSGAAQFKELAEKKGKFVINIEICNNFEKK